MLTKRGPPHTALGNGTSALGEALEIIRRLSARAAVR